jgi:hypothetical protein
MVQRFPINSSSSRPRVPYLPGDMIQVSLHLLPVLLQGHVGLLVDIYYIDCYFRLLIQV